MELTITGDIDEILASMNSFTDKFKASTPLTPTGVIAELDKIVGLQELLIAIEARLDAEGYEVVKKKPLVAERKKEEARAKLRGDLVGSLALAETEAKLGETQPEEEAPAEPEPAAKKVAAKKGNGKTPDITVLKTKCLAKLKSMYDSGRKAEVNKLLAEHGNGAKNFQQVPEENFVAIHDALQGVD
jgi:hypothetical protein